LLPVAGKSGSRQAPDIFEHYGRWFTVFHETKRTGEKITLIVRAELLTSYRKRRTGHAASEQVHAFIARSVKMVNIAFDDIPFRVIQTQRFAGVRINLDRGAVRKSSLVQTERLAASACANFQARQSGHRRGAFDGGPELALTLLESEFERSHFTRDHTDRTSLVTLA